MRTTTALAQDPRPARFTLIVALALATGCDDNHFLGVGDAGQPPGAAGSTSTGLAGNAGMGSGAGGTGAQVMGAGGAGPGIVDAGGPDSSTAEGGGASGSAGAKADPATLGAAQSWTGYVENHMFHSGSDALVLTFATDANGIAKGTVVLGMGTPPPPATDPNVGYPPDLLSQIFGAGPGSAREYVAEGYPYVFDGGSFDAHRLRFAVDTSQLWAGWCALQTPASDGSGQCLPNWGATFSTSMCALIDPNTQANVPVDCGKLSLCWGPTSTCNCSPSGCGLSTAKLGGADFDIFLTGDTASGSATSLGNVHFVKN
jgi:hypothetical protein